MTFDKNLFIDQCTLFFNFLLKKRQWSGITTADYIRWLKNFDQIGDGKYLATRILNYLLYYSEDDLIKMMDDVITGVFEKEVVLPLVKSKGFSCLPSEINFEVKKAVDKTLVVPSIEDVLDPGSSGPEIIRNIRNHFKPQLHCSFHHQISATADYDRIIIIDDCLGSGEQCRTFLTSAKISDGSNLIDWARSNQIKIFYIALVGYKQSVEDLRTDFPDIIILCAEYVDRHHQVFSETSKCWNSIEEQQEAAKALEEKLSEFGLPLKGYDDLNFTVVLHKTIPDWSLPSLYRSKNGWQHFIERKTTYV